MAKEEAGDLMFPGSAGSLRRSKFFSSGFSPVTSDESSAQSVTANDRIAAVRISQVTSMLNACLSRVGNDSGNDSPGSLGQRQAGHHVSDMDRNLDELEKAARELYAAIQLGDYAGHIWNCIRRASRGSLRGTVVHFAHLVDRDDKCEIEGNALNSLRAAIEELVRDQVEIDEDTAITAIRLYARRNLIVHTDQQTRFALHEDEQGLDDILRVVASDDGERGRLRRMVMLWNPVKLWMNGNQDMDPAPEEQDHDLSARGAGQH